MMTKISINNQDNRQYNMEKIIIVDIICLFLSFLKTGYGPTACQAYPRIFPDIILIELQITNFFQQKSLNFLDQFYCWTWSLSKSMVYISDGKFFSNGAKKDKILEGQYNLLKKSKETQKKKIVYF